MDVINWEQVVDTLASWGILLAQAIAIFIVGKILAKIILGIMTKVLQRSHTDEMLIKFARSITNAFLMLIIVIAALSVLGFNTTSLVAVLASAGLAIGLALQDSMKNFASGVLLLTFKPFGKGDYVDAGGSEGTVRSISLFSTDMLTLDNKHVIVPNGTIWSNVITNYTHEAQRRVDMVFGIGYSDDIGKARTIIEEILAANPLILADPAPMVAVSELADSSVNFVVRPWGETDDYWTVLFEVTEAVKLAFDEQGVSIPFPQMDVHLEQVA